MEGLGLALLGFVTAGIGALGGLGGAVILVPILVLFGTPVDEAAPLGLISVAAGSIAAASVQLEELTVNHRLGVATETAATAGAVASALLSGALSERTLTYSLAAVAVLAAVMGARRKGVRNRPDPSLGPDDVGEHVGTIAGAYPLHGAVVPYRADNISAGLAMMAASGIVAGLAGASGGFLKTPATSEIMHVPVKVAASTTTFTIGVTSAAALIVFGIHGRIDADAAAAVALGSALGAQAGAHVQARLAPPLVRRALSAVLLAVAVALVVSA